MTSTDTGEPQDESTPRSSVPESPLSGKKICPACRTINEPASAYCYKCGVKLPDNVLNGLEAIGKPAGFWIRLVAYIIDLVFLGIAGTVVILLVSDLLPYEIVPSDMMNEDIAYISTFGWRYTLINLAVEAVYWTIAIGAWGRTIGKAMLGITVVRTDGSKVSFIRSFFRYLAYIPSWLTFGIAFIVVALTPDKRGIHDLVCDTKVIRV